MNGGEYKCIDIDECLLKKDNCDENADCINTPGSYKCKCKEGFYGNGKKCDDITECFDFDRKIGCDENADCIELPGKSECKCHKGFEGDGYNCISWWPFVLKKKKHSFPTKMFKYFKVLKFQLFLKLDRYWWMC